MKKLLRGHSAVCARVERALALNRKAGLNFPGVFMEVAGHEKRNNALRLEFYDDPLFHDGRGELSWVALGVLADLVLGGVTRLQGGPTRRPATVHLALQMSGAPKPPRSKVRSRVVQQGRSLSVVRTQIVRSDGKLVLEATTQHAAG